MKKTPDTEDKTVHGRMARCFNYDILMNSIYRHRLGYIPKGEAGRIWLLPCPEMD